MGLDFVNPHLNPLLLNTTADGVVRLWRDTTSMVEKPTLVTAWQATSPHSQAAEGSSVIKTQWQQHYGRLLASSNKKVKIWDMRTERRTLELEVDTPITAMSCLTYLDDQEFGQCVFVGSARGTIYRLDPRAPDTAATLTVGSSRVVQLCFQNGLRNKLIARTIDGYVHFSDLRMPRNGPYSFHAFGKKSLDAFAVHNYSPLYACGSSKQVFRVYDFQHTELLTFKYSKGWMANRIAPITHLAWHPNKLILAAATKSPGIFLAKALPPKPPS